ncbi:GNAT family N-acetyltransferase [Massilia orientalis]|uniref:GNAT family N-acetyltransferase n=1 Tax=Massilia orientalis TaxID=3050128 RepID=A0ACC7ME47_9BURK
MLSKDLEDLLRAEHASSDLVHNAEIDDYIRKLGERAEILAHYENGCNGFVAYYCNDYESKKAFITMVVVRPAMRGKGIARALLQSVLGIMRQRGFTACSLEVGKHNTAAYRLYVDLGFRPSLEKDSSAILSMDLTI